MEQRIPNDFHFVFVKQTEPFHLMFYICLQSCIPVNKPDKVFFHYLHEPYGDYWQLIRTKVTPVQIDPQKYESWAGFLRERVSVRGYNEKGLYAHISDFIRLEILLDQGGIYADLDTLFVNKIPSELFSKPFVMGRECDLVDTATKTSTPSLCNAVIMSERNSEFGRIWLREMGGRYDGTWSKHSTLLPLELSSAHPDIIHIEPQRSFFYHDYTPAGIDTIFKGYDPNFEGIFSMHLWSSLWWSRWKRHFSTFHAGKLTESYVRKAKTTYAVGARSFLPERHAGGRPPILSRLIRGSRSEEL